MMFRQLLACIVLVAASTSASAARLIPDLTRLDRLPMHSLPALKMQRAVEIAQSKNQALQFAVSEPLALSLSDGTWQTLEDGNLSWRTRVYSAQAQTLNLHFFEFHLPAGAALWLYDPSGEVIAGPYTAANHVSDGQLWTAVVHGETAIVEIRVAPALKDKVRLQLAEVNHGYRGFAKASTGSFGDSDACEIDIACPAGSSYQAQARSMARISIGGTALCSGQLLNNVRQNNTPFFLTANHCGVNSSNASSVVFYWNYRNSTCGGNGSEPSNNVQSGSVWVAGNSESDFTLIRTAQVPSSSFNLFLAGWNAGGSAPQSGAVLHHPQGDVGKIATYTSAAIRSDNETLCGGNIVAGVCVGSSRTIDVWRVRYNQGVTEPGSSGAALYDQNRRVVGQLSGGASACSGNTGNGLADIYGRFNVAWASVEGSSNQLKANLDPDNSGTLTIAGKELGATSTTSTSGSTSSGGGGGGGALAPLSLLGLMLINLLRRRVIAAR